jgi:uncharacterized protein (DUF934 family)
MHEQCVIKDGELVSNKWHTVPKEAPGIPDGEFLIFPLAVWLANQENLSGRNNIGVWLDSEDMPTGDIASALIKLPLLAVNFPVFTDGRSFSIARLLRERFNYKGELRAIGYVLRDQLCFMKRCGFNSFDLRENTDLKAALESLNDFTEYYQTSTDQPQPLFRRN